MHHSRTLIIFSIWLLLSACGTGNYSTAYNLDFEYAERDSIPTRWTMIDETYHGYRTCLDSEHRQDGRLSLRMVQTDSTKTGWAIFSQELPADMVAGREVELGGWVRTSDVVKGFASLWLAENTDFSYDSLIIDTPGREIVRGREDWTHITVKKRFGNASSGAVIGGLLVGPGTAWFDNMELTIDRKLVQDSLIPAPKIRLSRADKRELRRYVYPLRTFEPVDGNSPDDLNILQQLIGDSKVVALGENTHGSRETFRMKDRIIRYLAANEGFDIFSIEAYMPESYLFNEYTQKGRGDARSLVYGQSFWIWRTQEMFEMVQWMRHFNRSEPHIAYTGFDIQAYQGSIAVLKKAFESDLQATACLDRLDAGFATVLTYSPINVPQVDPAAAEKLTADLRQIDRRIEESSVGVVEKAWLQQQITLLQQYLGQGPYTWRDRCMADNLLWIKQQNPDSRIVIWAHNGHVMKNNDKMGQFLDDSLGGEYVAFGFTFYEGSYTAIRPGSDLWQHEAESAYPGTLEYLLGQLDEQLFILDLKRIRAENSPTLKWIDRLKFRHVGAVKTEHEFYHTKITDDFDYLIFIRESTPSH